MEDEWLFRVRDAARGRRERSRVCEALSSRDVCVYDRALVNILPVASDRSVYPHRHDDALSLLHSRAQR